MIYRGLIYDVTELISRHPGGKESILKHAGKDVTDVFDLHHRSLKTHQKLLRLKTIGTAMNGKASTSTAWIPRVESFLPNRCFFFNEAMKELVQSIPNRLMEDTFGLAVEVMEGEFSEILAKVNTKDALTHQQLEMLHADLSYIATAYVVRKDDVSKQQSIPHALATLWVRVSEALGRKPMMDYSDCVLNNWSKDASGKVHLLRRFSGVVDEENFFILHLITEQHFDAIIADVAAFKNAACAGDSETMLRVLVDMKKWIDTVIVSTFKGMNEKCRPDVFWHVVRRYLGSWEDVQYGDLGKLSFSGPTGAHTSTVALLDAFLGIPDAEGPLAEKMADFDARRPPAHRELVKSVKEHVNARAMLLDGLFVSDQLYVQLLNSFNELAVSVIKLRDEHMGLVTTYILNYAPQAVGTGGTMPMGMLGGRKAQAIAALIVEKPLKVDPVAQGLLELDEAEVNPWDVKGKVDYEKLISHFGCERITQQQRERMLNITKKNGVNKLHHLIEREIFFSHRDLDQFLSALERGESIYIYTGRGPSGGMHVGHLLPFKFTCWLQRAFNAQVVIQMTDDEKFLFRDMSVDEVETALIDNIKDIIAVGFDPERTFIFSNYAYMGVMYPLVTRIQKLVTGNQLKGIFGFELTNNIGMWAFAPTQAAPSFSDAFPHLFPPGKNMWCLIPQAIDQDPYFRMTRDVAPRLGYNKPALMHSKFFTSLQGPKGKMSAHDPTTAIFLTDTQDEIRTKIMKYAFSGGQSTAEEQKRLGANLDVDVAYQIMLHFCEDDAYVDHIGQQYKSGQMMTSKIKSIAAEFVQKLISEHQHTRAMVTDETIRKFTKFDPSLRATIPSGVPM